MKQLLITIAAAILATVSGIAQSGQAIGNRAYWLWENQSEVDFKDGFEIKLLDRCALKLKDESSLTVFSKGGLPF